MKVAEVVVGEGKRLDGWNGSGRGDTSPPKLMPGESGLFDAKPQGADEVDDNNVGFSEAVASAVVGVGG